MMMSGRASKRSRPLRTCHGHHQKQHLNRPSQSVVVVQTTALLKKQRGQISHGAMRDVIVSASSRDAMLSDSVWSSPTRSAEAERWIRLRIEGRRRAGGSGCGFSPTASSERARGGSGCGLSATRSSARRGRRSGRSDPAPESGQA